MKKEKTVSIIINTYNRAYHLKRLLDALALQTYDNFEVIVVNGPSDDNTDDICKEYKDIVKWVTCPVVNLCVSRNIGVNASSGDIIAFIDDDAIPCDKYWIENAVKPFEDDSVGIVGGLVKRINNDIEFSFGTITIFGENVSKNPLPGQYFDPKGEKFNGIAGGNSFFKKEAVIEVGSFDEYYIYYMDETDLCMRIAKAGYKVIHVSDANIYHEAAKSPNRKSKYHLNWDVITKSLGYFIIKATENYSYDIDTRKNRAIKAIDHWLEDFKFMLKEGYISKNDYKDFVKQANNGVRQGIEDGFQQERKLNSKIQMNEMEFKIYDKKYSCKNMNICMLCESNIFTSTGGVPVYTKMFAKQFVKMGHNIHIIISGDECYMTNIEGVNVYVVKPELLNQIPEVAAFPNSKRVLEFSYECFKMLQVLKKVFNIQIVESPIWDVHGVVSSYLEKDIPLVTRLQTPLKMVIDTFEMKENPDLEMIQMFEKELLSRSDSIITISDCVKDTIEKLYDMQFSQNVYKNYLGIESDHLASYTRKDDNIVILFLGRLERRKGIQNIMESIPEILSKYNNVEFRLAGDFDIKDDLISDTFKNKFTKDYKKSSWFNRIHFLGKISDEQKESEFANCDIFISPSLYESFGIIFVEAMRYSKPVIGCNVGGMKEVIADGESGLLAETNDTNSLIDKLNILIKDPELREKMGRIGKERVEEIFNVDKMCDDSISIYKKVIDQYCHSNSSLD